MALNSLRLRRGAALSLTSTLLNHLHHPSKATSALISASGSCTLIPHRTSAPQLGPFFQWRLFRSTTASLSSRARSFDPDKDEIGPDTILFEGCDYNHWLITVDFPKDPRPSREEMIETYVQTAAKVFGSVEEAKKRIYALSTTTYQGFQVECSEETSEKFNGLPGVVFVLPDSYIDPVNKEYGGDKYVNGEIFPRPPPVHYGTTRRRNPNRNSDFNQRSRGDMSYQPGNSGYGEHRNYGPPQQNYGPPQQQNFGPPQQQNYGPRPQQNYAPRPQQNYSPQAQQNYGQPPNQNYGSPRQQYYAPQAQQTYAPSPQQNYAQSPQQSNESRPRFSSERNYSPPGTGPMPTNNVPGGLNNPNGSVTHPLPAYPGNYNQGATGNYYAQGQKDYMQGNQQHYSPPNPTGFRQDGQNNGSPHGGGHGQGAGGANGQEATPSYGQNFPGHQGDQRYSETDQGSGQSGYQRNF